jgi:hypothetical protein
MSEHASGIKRIRSGKGFRYTLDGDKVPGVTSVLKVLPLDALIDWAANTTAEYALDHLAELAKMPPSVCLNTLKRSRYLVSDPAKHRGTEVHRYGQSLIEGQALDLDLIPQELRGHVLAYRDWLDDIQPVPLATELLLASREFRYCGLADLVADLPDAITDDLVIPACRWLLEVKTNEKGPYPESALQASAYEHADLYVHPEHPDAEQPMSLLGIQRCGVVTIWSDRCELRALETGPEVWEVFRTLRWLFDQMERSPSGAMRLPAAWIGGPVAAADLVPAT